MKFPGRKTCCWTSYVMSGRSGFNKGKRSHRKPSDYSDSRQSSNSSNHHNSSRYHAKEPPPRFLSRQRGPGGDGGDFKDYYNDHSSGRRDGGSGTYKGSGGRTGSVGSLGNQSSGGRMGNFGECKFSHSDRGNP